MIIILPCVFIIIWLFGVWIPRDQLEKHIGKGSGIKGIGSMLLLAVIQPDSLYVAFPFALLLWKKAPSLLKPNTFSFFLHKM
ncbi:MAG: hypothetical protein ACOC59_01380 [Bacteroidota bacterium]